jgi:SAM-dependent methyltransferase
LSVIQCINHAAFLTTSLPPRNKQNRRIIKYNKARAAEISCKYGKDYWDGDRQYGYGGYKYMEGYRSPVAEAMINHYNLPSNDKILDVGCGKGFLLYEFTKLFPEADIYGIDISKYAVENAKKEIRHKIIEGNANSLPFEDDSFDHVYALGCMHNLYNFELFDALKEMERVGNKTSTLCRNLIEMRQRESMCVIGS